MAIEAFCEERFPLGISFGTTGGPERRTEIVRLSTGFEQRNQRGRHAMRRYDAGSGLRSLADLEAVLDFFEARRGRLVGFRFRDPIDFSSARRASAVTAFDQELGVGDGETSDFQLRKRYGSGPDAYWRPIEKPVTESVVVAFGGEAMPAGEFSVDAATGIVSLQAPPGAGVSVTAGFEFDVPVRFDIDQLSVNIAAFEAGDIPSLPLVEVRP